MLLEKLLFDESSASQTSLQENFQIKSEAGFLNKQLSSYYDKKLLEFEFFEQVGPPTLASQTLVWSATMED